MEYRGYNIETDGRGNFRAFKWDKREIKKGIFRRRVVESVRYKKYIDECYYESVDFNLYKPKIFKSLKEIKEEIDFKIDGWQLVEYENINN